MKKKAEKSGENEKKSVESGENEKKSGESGENLIFLFLSETSKKVIFTPK